MSTFPQPPEGRLLRRKFPLMPPPSSVGCARPPRGYTVAHQHQAIRRERTRPLCPPRSWRVPATRRFIIAPTILHHADPQPVPCRRSTSSSLSGPPPCSSCVTRERMSAFCPFPSFAISRIVGVASHVDDSRPYEMWNGPFETFGSFFTRTYSSRSPLLMSRGW